MPATMMMTAAPTRAETGTPVKGSCGPLTVTAGPESTGAGVPVVLPDGTTDADPDALADPDGDPDTVLVLVDTDTDTDTDADPDGDPAGDDDEPPGYGSGHARRHP